MYKVCKMILYKCTKNLCSQLLNVTPNTDRLHRIWSFRPHDMPQPDLSAGSRRLPMLSAYPAEQMFYWRYPSVWYHIFFCFLSSSNSYRSLLFICAVQAAPTTAPPQIPRLPTFCFPLYLKACPYVRTTKFLRQYLLSFYKIRQNNHNILIIW